MSKRQPQYAWNENCDGLLAFDDIDMNLSVLPDPSSVVETQRQFATASCSTPIQRFSDSDRNQTNGAGGAGFQQLYGDDTFPVIPTLGDVEFEDSMSHVAVAPRSTVILSLKDAELDVVNDLAAFCTLDDNIDVKLLYGRMLAPADLIQEEQGVSWQQMMADVSSAMRLEQEQQQVRDEQPRCVEHQDSIITF